VCRFAYSPPLGDIKILSVPSSPCCSAVVPGRSGPRGHPPHAPPRAAHIPFSHWSSRPPHRRPLPELACPPAPELACPPRGHPHSLFPIFLFSSPIFFFPFFPFPFSFPSFLSSFFLPYVFLSSSSGPRAWRSTAPAPSPLPHATPPPRAPALDPVGLPLLLCAPPAGYSWAMPAGTLAAPACTVPRTPACTAAA
jgi:hypothetical protein